MVRARSLKEPVSLECADVLEAHTRAVSCIKRLPRRQRIVFVLRYLEKMSCEEVAHVLGIPEATVRTRVYHGRRRLRQMMRETEQ